MFRLAWAVQGWLRFDLPQLANFKRCALICNKKPPKIGAAHGAATWYAWWCEVQRGVQGYGSPCGARRGAGARKRGTPYGAARRTLCPHQISAEIPKLVAESAANSGISAANSAWIPAPRAVPHTAQNTSSHAAPCLATTLAPAPRTAPRAAPKSRTRTEPCSYLDMYPLVGPHQKHCVSHLLKLPNASKHSDNMGVCGSKLNHQGPAGFSPCFHLPGFRSGYQCFWATSMWLWVKTNGIPFWGR